ncbi:nucleotide-sugar transporter-domain-containing protein [Dactylonectria macrodidyma]|uniref:Nucleotide-sugar transporter-domain-containing protein n=1 Tax=Dactylonectria macrodidyma TaxID=307937 RepID=A0A9P9FHL4_9HYPO|nr:nucleotide-sugar transporter-domain-containing protein [Dactylonectria macrodidyma]
MAILDRYPRGVAPASQGSFLGLTKKQWSLTALTFQNSALILIMHYSRVMPPSGDHRYFTSTAVFLNEVIKLAVSLTLAIYETSKTLAPTTPATVLFEQIYNSVFAGDGWKLAVVAAFYTLQNLLQYVAVGNLDAVHFQILYQLKIIITALFSVKLLRRHLTPKRWFALVILTLGVCIVSLPQSDPSSSGSLPVLHDMTDHFFPRSLHELGHAPVDFASGGSLSKRSATYQGIDHDLPPPDPLMDYSVGLSAVLVAASVSGLTSVYFEKLLKDSPTQASVWIRNVQLSFYSLFAALFGGVMWQDGTGIREHGFFEGYNWVVWSAVILQAAGGLIVSVVIRDTDNIVKNFATSISIIVSFVISVFVFNFEVTFTFILGTSCVLLSTYIYSSSERTIHRPAAIKIAKFERPTIERVYTPRGTSGARLTLAPFDEDVGITTSRPNSPMLPRQPSRTNIKRED